MSFALGAVPAEMTVRVSHDSDFSTIIRNSAGPWEIGAEVKLVFAGGITWDAEIVDNEASWRVDKVDVNALLSKSVPVKGRVRLIYTLAAKDVLWATGKVSIYE